MRNHDPLCPVRRWHRSHFQFCHCALIHEVREDERKRGEDIARDMVEQAMQEQRERIAASLWPYIEPITTWIAGVNTEKEASRREGEKS